MALYIPTDNPGGLLTVLKKAIDTGEVTTWECDSFGFFTHSPERWRERAWFRPFVVQGVLQFGIVANTNIPLNYEIYSIYHGRFIEMLISHFHDQFDDVKATTKPVEEVDVPFRTGWT